MKKTLLCLLSCLWIAVSAEASPIGKQKAQAIAHSFLTEKGVNVDCLKSSAEGLTTPAADGSRPFYVFNNGSNKGFVIVSGDDRAPKILGYSYTGSFQEENIPENLSSWLGSYASEMQILKKNTKIQSRLRKAEMQQARVSISPLVMTHWNQYAPYYNLTPTSGGKQCLTGCVATAFAQVMKYYEWPKEATNPMIQEEEVILPSIEFKWSKMLNDYQGGLYSGDACNDAEEYQTAVAELMLYCGKSVYASYGTGGTSASISFIPDAMKKYFLYQGNIVEANRSNYSSAEWDDMIYNELYNGRPVIYSGKNPSSGHAFVCDGYGEDGYFHINWGWGGMSDGYYLLSILEPGAQGAGGSNAGYSMNQSVIIGIQPEAPTEVEAQRPCLSILDFNVDDNYESTNGPQGFGISHQFQGLVDGEKQYNAQLLKNGEVMYEGTPKSTSLGAGWLNSTVTTSRFFANQTLADGTYEVRLVCRLVEEGKDNEWIPCAGSEKYINQVTIEGNKVVGNNTIVTPIITCSGFTTSPTIFVSNKTSGVAHLSNEGSLYFQGKIYLWLDGEKVVEDMAYIDAGKSIDLSLTFTPSNTGTLPVKITTDSNGEEVVYEGSVTVVEEDESAAYKLELTDWSIENLDKESGKICGGAVSGTLTVTNTGDKTYSGRIGTGYSSGGGSSMSTPSTIYTLAPGESVILVYNVENPTIGNSYSLACWENGSWSNFIGRTNSYQLVEGGCTYWTADGTSKSQAEVSNESISIVDDAVAVKFFNTPTGTVNPNSNPNTLYYLSGSSVPPRLLGKNVILNGKANEVTFADGSNFYVPLGFTATKATYTRVPTLGANGSSGWETILLPFPVQKVMNQTDDKQIYWFVSPDDDGKDFWLKSFSATDGETVFFDFVDEIRANVPYIIATPGNKWGVEYDLRGKTMAFIAENVKVPESSKFKAMTDNINFVGVSTQQNVTGYVLDEIGKYFVMKEDAPLKAFRAFFTVDDTAPVVSAPRLKIDSYQTDDITDITGVTDGEADVYSLDGVKVGTVSVNQGKADVNHLPQGIYIVNGKKIQRQ